MELLIAAGVTVLTQIYKWLAGKWGGERAKTLILVVAFVLSVAGTLGWEAYSNTLDLSDADNIISVFGLAIGYYEVVVKKLLNPIFK